MVGGRHSPWTDPLSGNALFSATSLPSLALTHTGTHTHTHTHTRARTHAHTHIHTQGTHETDTQTLWERTHVEKVNVKHGSADKDEDDHVGEWRAKLRVAVKGGLQELHRHLAKQVSTFPGKNKEMQRRLRKRGGGCATSGKKK